MGSFSMKSSETSHLPSLKCDTAFTHESQGLGLDYQLGSDYEKKKRKLLQELQLDYKDYVTKVFPQKNNLKPHEPSLHHKGLSLPINERASIKDRLREERNKEYNLFLQELAQKRRLKRETPPVPSKPAHFQASEVVSITSQVPSLPFLNTQTNTSLTYKECPASRRDAATLTEIGDTGGKASNLDPPRRRRWQIHKPRELHSSEEELSTDEEDDFDFSRRRRQDKEPRCKEEKRTQKRRVDRAVQDINEMEAHVLSHQNKDGVMESASKHIPDSMRTAAISTPVTCKDNAESATGLMIGAIEDQTITQMKKEQYKQELLKQIAEQQKNKIKEKKLELKVAATGATDPEKEPDRIKQLRTANQQYENSRQDASHKSGIDLEAVGKDANPKDKYTHYRAHRGNSQVDFNTTLSQLPGMTIPGPGMGLEQDVPPLDYFSEDYHGNFTRIPGEVALPRIASVAPPFPPMVPNTYKTPYDAAHSFYRTRNPLEIQDNLHGGAQQFRNFETLPQWLPSVRANEGSPFATEGHHADMSKQRRESVLRYQEALKQQIQERETHKRREKEEKERSDAKSEGEMMTYDPWGRSGGGAPIKDQYGNLISDLKQMHIINKNRMLSPRAGSPFPHQLSGSSHQSPPQQLYIQDRYKEELKQQIEENRRRRAEEQESLRIAAEKEEKRLEEERARMLQQYEEEQRKQKETQNNAKKKRQAHEVQTQLIEEVKSTKQKNQTVPQSAKEREEKTSLFTYQRDQRQPSPPIPTLQRKHRNPAASKPNSVERSLSAPHVQPLPRNIPTPQEGQQEVIKELSALRNFLKKEQRQLEQLGLAETYHSHLGRRRLRMDTVEAANKESVHPLARYPASANAEKQNNQLKNGDVLDYQPIHYYSRRKPVPFIPRNASLPFEVAFTDEHNVKQLVPRQGAQGPGQLQGSDRTVPSIRSEGSGKMAIDNKGSCEGQINQQGGSQPSEERHEMTASQRKQVVADFLDERERNDQVGNHFLKSYKAKDTNRNRRRDFERGDHSSKTGSTLRRSVSLGTVATELRLHSLEHQKV